MSRNFTGSRQGGGKASGSGSTLGIRTASSGGGKSNFHNFYKLSAKARFEKVMWMKKEERIQATMEKMAAAKGGEANKKVQQFMEQQKAKRARAQAKKEKAQEMTVRAVNFSGGRVDGKGNIYDASGKVVGKVNLETKEISIGFGKLGKFKDTPSGIYELELAVKKLNAPKPAQNGGSVWGVWGDLVGLLGPKDNN